MAASKSGSSSNWSCDITRTVKLVVGDEGHSASPPVTVGQLFRSTKKKFAGNVAFAVKDGNTWRKMNFASYYDLCVRAAKSLNKVYSYRIFWALVIIIIVCVCVCVCVCSAWLGAISRSGSYCAELHRVAGC